MFNNNKSNITLLHKKLSTIVCIAQKICRPLSVLHKKFVDHCLYCTKNLSTIVCIVVKTKKYKASCFLKRQY